MEWAGSMYDGRRALSYQRFVGWVVAGGEGKARAGSDRERMHGHLRCVVVVNL